ncbi:MAG: DNA gyrase/topoisomerase IV subunit A [Bacteroidales bacterium]|nr:DNA gyrase/topoisomerase IV subunit A [Bacteroidales bacterium]
MDNLDNKSDENLENQQDNNGFSDNIDDAGELKKTVSLSDMYETWFLDYASYVILERAVPDIKDGFKPVQRRLLHAMKELDDGRYNKVANIIGHTMKYHPHGDASIGDALVQLGQKDLLIDTQGNWGNTLTGDNAAAPRYIEARLSKFALDIVFNPKTTLWKTSYDGRNKEPITFPVKFPLLLAQGIEGIAVGLASKIFPHNFNELIDASIKHLNGEEFEIMPDFPTGGLADFSKYSDGLRGGRIKVRAKIQQLDKKTLCITELPFSKTTNTLIETIISANDRGKIKIKKIEDNTAENVEILIHLPPGVSPDQTIDALYAFTDCEVSLNPNACVIDTSKPRFIGVSELLKIATQNTLDLLEQELKIKINELLEQIFFSSLEKIFIEKRIYRQIEKSETWENVIETIDKGLDPFRKLFYREITKDDILKLTELKIKRISKFDISKADEAIKALEENLAETENYLNNLVQYAIDFYLKIKNKYGKGKERKTEIRNFDIIEATKVAVANEKLYVNREEGFAGTSLKKDEYVCECSDIDDIIAIKDDGTFIVTKVTNKVFLGKNIIYINVFNKNDERTIYNLIYFDGDKKRSMVKRFPIVGVQRDKSYSLIKGNKYSKVLYFTVNPNGEAEVVTIHHKPVPRLKIFSFDFDFSSIEIKGRSAGGNILTKRPIKKIALKEEGISTLSAINVWFDDTVKRLNYDNRGQLLGSFLSDDKIISFTKSGHFRFTGYDVTMHFDDDLLLLRKYNEKLIVSAIYFEEESNTYYLKRFNVEISDKKVSFIGDNPNNKLIAMTCLPQSKVHINYPDNSRKKILEEVIDVDEFIGVKSFKAKGKRLCNFEPETIQLIEPEFVEELEEIQEVIEVINSEAGEDFESNEDGENFQGETEAETETEAEAKGEKEELKIEEPVVKKSKIDKKDKIKKTETPDNNDLTIALTPKEKLPDLKEFEETETTKDEEKSTDISEEPNADKKLKAPTTKTKAPKSTKKQHGNDMPDLFSGLFDE